MDIKTPGPYHLIYKIYILLVFKSVSKKLWEHAIFNIIVPNILQGLFDKDEQLQKKKKKISELFSIYNHTFELFSIKCYKFHPTPLPFIQYVLKCFVPNAWKQFLPPLLPSMDIQNGGYWVLSCL